MAYEYHRIARLNEQLEKNKIDPIVVADVMEGGDKILASTKHEKKADWLREAMVKLTVKLDYETIKKVREGCACCLGGKRLKDSKAIYKNGKNLQERIALADKTPFVFGHSVNLKEDGKIVVRFGPEGPATFKCPCLPKAASPLPIAYCMCCGGHVKHHLQTATGLNLDCRVVSSILASGGEQTCVFEFTQV